MAASLGVPVIAVCGRTTLSSPETRAAGCTATYPLTDLEPDVARRIAGAGDLLELVGAEIGARLPDLGQDHPSEVAAGSAPVGDEVSDARLRRPGQPGGRVLG